MIDIRLYKPSGEYYDTNNSSEGMDRVVPDDAIARSIEVIAGKVVKFMLTEKGSDAFDGEYGGTSMHYQQMSQMFLPQFKREVHTDVENCEKYIKKSEIANNVSGEKLLTINVLKISYDPVRTPTRVDVFLEINTTLGKRACVAITNRTAS
jgi:hypothetical protein